METSDFLEQFTAGQSQEVVRSCQYMPPDRGYLEAKRQLKKHFRDEYTIATAYLDMTMNWPSIKVEDADSLISFSLFLNSCLNAMNSIDYLKGLDHPVNMKAIIAKLPFKLKEKWRSKAFELQDQRGRRARFADLVHFVDNQAQAQLLQGPDFTNSLVGVLIRLCQNPVAFMADIEAMFHQVRIPEGNPDL